MAKERAGLLVSEEIGFGFGFTSGDINPHGVRVGEGYDVAGFDAAGDI